ncbi:hypothetical protein MLD63_07280 [Paracoccus sp. TK19116]|uniref:DUF2336 domain-containing protein n=1 Tax=Paracoccus albicereus TaxID=2922394 RepID=A0ABT1MRR9_9RHOB|nr:hypothetical protein [Paracoccus albicereus]MCQ0970221.1 hypothetical protein [Paracoccus albicereus]
MGEHFIVNRQAGSEYVLPGCDVHQLRLAVDTHPGPVEPEEVNFDLAPQAVFRQCLEAADNKGGEILVTSMLLRLIALRWQEREATTKPSKLALDIPDLLRPQSNLRAEIGAFVLAFDDFAARLCALPKPLPSGTPPKVDALMRHACENRMTLRQMHEGIQQMVQLKRLHDALHSLQVMAEMPQGDGAQPQSLLDLMVRQTREAIAGPLDALNAGGQKCLVDCRRVLDQAHDLLQKNDPGSDTFAMHCLRLLFRTEMTRLDRLLFTAVSNWPLRALIMLMERGADIDFNYDRVIAVSLHNNLLRRILAHSVWQDVDFRLYAMEDILRREQQGWFVELLPHAQSVHFMLRKLNAVADGQPALTAELLGALEAFEASEGPDGSARIQAAVAHLAPVVRRRFHEVDRQLKADFDRFLSLGATLDDVVGWLPIAI